MPEYAADGLKKAENELHYIVETNSNIELWITASMPEKTSQPSESPEESTCPVQENRVSGDGSSSADSDSAVPRSKFKKILAAVNAFLESLDEEEEPEPPPPPEKPLKESVRELIERCRDREKRIVMLKEAGEWCWTMFFRGTVFFFLFVLTIWGTIWALDFSENHRIKFYPPDEVVAYLTAEHENLEETARRMTPLVGRDDNLPFERFDAKLIETVRPIRIYSDEYGIYFMTSKDWYNGEHGIFIAKDEENMPPDINWGLIEGRIYTYAIYD